MRTTTTTTTRAPRTTTTTTVPPMTTVPRTTKTTTTTTTTVAPITSKKSSFLDLFGIFGKKETAQVDLESKIIKQENLEKNEKMEEEMMIKKSQDSPKKPKFRTTVTPPITSEAPPPWISTTATVPTTTTVFTTHAPPPMEGCNTKDANGREIFTHIGAIMRVSWKRAPLHFLCISAGCGLALLKFEIWFESRFKIMRTKFQLNLSNFLQTRSTALLL
ncbi:hypothetical protein CRE_20075 [Caenorhabditis remanei]|uniref:Uncharacterized protein n=1 Tax=Caenorhabditis remanei TaxID=31234 RepID=E3NIW6_CAERE|nr:hypothetical protein CRE_20075 [Caenorhabditis remanei]